MLPISLLAKREARPAAGARGSRAGKLCAKNAQPDDTPSLPQGYEHVSGRRVQLRVCKHKIFRIGESGETFAMTSAVGGNDLPESLSGPCR